MCTDLGIHCSKSARDCMKWGPGQIGSHLRPKRSSHQSEFVFLLFFRFGFFLSLTEILSLLSRVKHGRYMFIRYKGGSSLVIF